MNERLRPCCRRATVLDVRVERGAEAVEMFETFPAEILVRVRETLTAAEWQIARSIRMYLGGWPQRGTRDCLKAGGSIL